jgi:hypothetical protein
VVAKFKSHKVRSAATVALPTTTGARAAAAAAEGDPIFSASNLDAGSGFFAAAIPMSQGEVEGGGDIPMEGGADGEAQVERPARRRRRMGEIRGERGWGGSPLLQSPVGLLDCPGMCSRPAGGAWFVGMVNL